MRRGNRWHVIGRGFAGWHATGKNVSSSGGDAYDRAYTRADGSVDERKGYLSEAYAGCLVYDASEADAAAYTRHVISGPMVDPSLKPYEVERFTSRDRENARAMLPALGGGFRALATLAVTDAAFGGLDKVGVKVFAALLRSIPGVKVGWVRKGTVVWEKRP